MTFGESNVKPRIVLVTCSQIMVVLCLNVMVKMVASFLFLAMIIVKWRFSLSLVVGFHVDHKCKKKKREEKK